jgi:hypothetical protein
MARDIDAILVVLPRSLPVGWPNGKHGRDSLPGRNRVDTRDKPAQGG